LKQMQTPRPVPPLQVAPRGCAGRGLKPVQFCPARAHFLVAPRGCAGRGLKPIHISG